MWIAIVNKVNNIGVGFKVENIISPWQCQEVHKWYWPRLPLRHLRSSHGQGYSLCSCYPEGVLCELDILMLSTAGQEQQKQSASWELVRKATMAAWWWWWIHAWEESYGEEQKKLVAKRWQEKQFNNYTLLVGFSLVMCFNTEFTLQIFALVTNLLSHHIS